MTRRVYLVEKIDMSEGYESVSKVFTTYLAAVNHLKTLVADTFIFDHIWNSSIDGDTYTHTIELEDMKMFSRMAKQVYEFPLEEYFNKNEYDVKDEEPIAGKVACTGEITLETNNLIFMIRAVEEET